jgi:ligand-binding SRPBCC domain-containing protein
MLRASCRVQRAIVPEEVLFGVIPSNARDRLFRTMKGKKQIPRVNPAPRNDNWEFFCAACVVRRFDEMKTQIYVRRSRFNASAADVYAWHALPDALERLTPPGEHVKVIERRGGIEKGARVVLQFGRWPFQQRWVAEHQEFEEGRYFSDVQVSGPFAYWKHTHKFEPDGAHACFLEDRVEYALPFGVIGQWAAGRYVRRKLEKLFEYRHQVTMREVGAQ